MNIKWIIIALLSLVLIGCGQATSTPELLDRPPFDALDGTSWKLTHFGGVEVLPGTEISIGFDDFKLAGNAGCNSYEAEYDVRGEGIKVHEIMWTLMACLDEEMMDQEQVYLSILQEAASFELEDNQLTLITSENRKLVFVPADN